MAWTLWSLPRLSLSSCKTRDFLAEPCRRRNSSRLVGKQNNLLFQVGDVFISFLICRKARHFRWWKPTGEGAHCHHPWQVPFLGPEMFINWKWKWKEDSWNQPETNLGQVYFTKPCLFDGIIPSDLRHRCWQSLIFNNIYVYLQTWWIFLLLHIYFSFPIFWDMFHSMFEHVDLRKLSEYSSVASHQVHR